MNPFGQVRVIDRFFTRYLMVPFLVALPALLLGCFAILSEETSGPKTYTTNVLQQTSLEAPMVSVTPHDDALGWTVTVTEEIVQQMEQRSSQQWTGRRYVFSPLSIFAGLFQCPLGLFSLFERNPTSNYRRFGCRRLLMFEPLAGSVPLPPTVSSEMRTEVHRNRLAHGMIQLIWPGASQHSAAYSLGADGKAELRLSHLLTHLQLAGTSPQLIEDQSLLIRAHYAGGHRLELPVFVTARQLQLAHLQKPSPTEKDRWPSPLILQIRIEDQSVPAQEQHFLRDRLTSWALQRNICTVATETMRQHLLDEQRIQYEGPISDDRQIRVGQMLPPSVFLTASMESHPLASHITLQITSIRYGEILATASVTERSESASSGVDTVLAKLDLLMTNAAKVGCPKPELVRAN